MQVILFKKFTILNVRVATHMYLLECSYFHQMMVKRRTKVYCEIKL